MKKALLCIKGSSLFRKNNIYSIKEIQEKEGRLSYSVISDTGNNHSVPLIGTLWEFKLISIPEKLSELKKGQYAKYIGPSMKNFINYKVYKLVADYFNNCYAFQNEKGVFDGFEGSNQIYFTIPTIEDLNNGIKDGLVNMEAYYIKERQKSLNNNNNNNKTIMKKSEVIAEIAKRTGYSESHISNVIAGRRVNNEITLMYQGILKGNVKEVNSVKKEKKQNLSSEVKREKSSESKSIINHDLGSVHECLGVTKKEQQKIVNIIKNAVINNEKISKTVETLIKDTVGDKEITLEHTAIFMKGVYLSRML